MIDQCVFWKETVVTYFTYYPDIELGVMKKKKNSVALVRKRTIPTERPPLSAK
jgi:hypothetical protein